MIEGKNNINGNETRVVCARKSFGFDPILKTKPIFYVFLPAECTKFDIFSQKTQKVNIKNRSFRDERRKHVKRFEK